MDIVENSVPAWIVIGILAVLVVTVAVFLGASRRRTPDTAARKAAKSWQGSTQLSLRARDLAEYQPGHIHPVRYNPANPQNVVVSAHDRHQQILNQIRAAKGLSDPEAATIEHDGSRAQAELIRAERTGRVLAGESEFSFTVRLADPAAPQWEMTKTAYFTEQRARALVPGRLVTIWYLPGTTKFIASFPANG